MLGVLCFYCELSTNRSSTIVPKKTKVTIGCRQKKKKPSQAVGVCEYSVSWVTIILAHSNCKLVLLGHHYRLVLLVHSNCSLVFAFLITVS